MRKGVDGSQVITVVTNNGAATDNFKLHVKGHGFKSGTEVSKVVKSFCCLLHKRFNRHTYSTTTLSVVSRLCVRVFDLYELG